MTTPHNNTHQPAVDAPRPLKPARHSLRPILAAHRAELLTASALFLLAAALFALIQWATPGIVGNDGYYHIKICLLYTSPSPRDGLLSRMPSSA